MTNYIIRRVLLASLSVVLVIIATFVMLRLIPGDALTAQVLSTSGGNVSPADIAKMKTSLGLDGSLPEQFGTYLSNLLHWNWGRSYVSNEDTLSEFLDRLPVTAELGILAMFFAVIIGIPVGIVSAIYQDSPIDYIGRIVAVGGLAIPNFWLGILIIVFASRQFHYAFPKATISLFSDPLGNLSAYVVPALVLSFGISATTMRLMRTAMLEVWRQDYVRTAHAKGLPMQAVIVRHAMRNALLPVVTIIGAQLALLIGGSVIVESLFSMRGIGLLVLQSINTRDYAMVQTAVLILAMVLVLGNLFTDLTYALLDPRIRYQ